MDRTRRWLTDLAANLDQSAELVDRGREAFDADPAVRLAFEALGNRVGDLCNRLIAADPSRFSDPIWRQAARNRDFLVHHYDRVDEQALWVTVSVSFPELRERLETYR
ncbi:hypothetical protein D477_012440 [Arthrobacter crystallopoietes BAB-32]|uniref:DUF86 domain-containing protein n=1 Tax=Arthrobacter crystallopoietes BAB-32 TaxID=1246476 RepID=N1V1E5_9MICC|nr:hypothetical protein D477_012440 [Arthrobacter crystallopoietes BAB-32]